MTHDCDVLIVGAGPTGVTLALLLAQEGVTTILVEREADIYPLPRAAHIDHEVMRILQTVGVADAVMAGARRAAHYDFLTADRQLLLRFDGADRIGPGGWPAANMIHQPSVERALRAALADAPEATLRSSALFESFVEDTDGITARARINDEPSTIRARWLIGADGARSPVRTAAGIDIDDLGFDEPWLVIDTIVRDVSKLPTSNLQICDPARPTTCVLMGEGRHRWEFMIRPGERAEDVLDDAFIARLLAPWNVADAVTLERKAVYRFNARVARHWRKGRVLLAGDAAHQMPPFAGQGLCSGLRDAANLAWKIGAITRGGPVSLLDAYQPEREPNVRAIIGMAMMMGRTVCITDPAAAAERDAQMLAARAVGKSPDGGVSYPPIAEGCILAGAPAAGAYFPQACAGSLKLDDVLGHGPWLIARRAPAPSPVLRCVELDAAEMAPFAQTLSLWLDQRHADAVLVRPDRYVFGAGDAATLRDGWGAALSASTS
jgi:3-(3-hydroxy-phenyl)propionate hydroxylase